MIHIHSFIHSFSWNRHRPFCQINFPPISQSENNTLPKLDLSPVMVYYHGYFSSYLFVIEVAVVEEVVVVP